VITFRAPEAPDFALISSPELAKPPDGKIVLALGALDRDRGHGLDILVLVIDDHDLLFLAQFFGRHLVICIDLADISAFPALELTPG
jgi:hypothetical protein